MASNHIINFYRPLFYLAMGTMIGLPIPTMLDLHYSDTASGVIQAGLILPIIVVNFSYFYYGLRSLFRRSPKMDSLIAVGAGAAILYSGVALLQQLGLFPSFEYDMNLTEDLYFESAAVILTLVTLGSYFEAKAKAKLPTL